MLPISSVALWSRRHSPPCGLTPDTLVWSEGMTEWTRIADIPELSRYLAPPAPGYGGYGTQYGPNMPMYKPDSNLVWAILTTILCCLPTGIYAIVCASKVDSLWNQGLYAEAQRMSKQAKLWSWIGAGVGLFFSIIYCFIYGVAIASQL